MIPFVDYIIVIILCTTITTLIIKRQEEQCSVNQRDDSIISDILR